MRKLCTSLFVLSSFLFVNISKAQTILYQSGWENSEGALGKDASPALIANNAVKTDASQTGSNYFYCDCPSAITLNRVYTAGVAITIKKAFAIYWTKIDIGGSVGTGWGAAATSTTNTLTANTWAQINSSYSNTSSSKSVCPTYTTSAAAKIYVDNMIIYQPAAVTDAIDLTAPSSPTIGSCSTSQLQWSNGTDAGTGLTATILLKTTNINASAPVLQNQAPYAVGQNPSGVTATGSDWTIVSIAIAKTATTYSITTNSDTKYAIIHRDFVYNYSTAATVSITPTGYSLTSANGTNSQTLCINSPITDITYSLTNSTGASASGLPNGVTGSYSSGIFTISGTPTQSGNFTYTITSLGSYPTSISGTINIKSTCTTPTITSTMLYEGGITVSGSSSEANGTIITVYKNGGTSIGTTTVSNGVWSATVPSLTLNDVITSVATATGKCDSGSSSSFTVVSSSLPTIGLTSGLASQNISAGTSIGNIVYTWGGSATSATVTWTGTSSSITLPTGITVDNNSGSGPITISGTPSEAGTYGYSLTSSDGTNVSSALSGTITVKLVTPDVSAGATTITGSGFTAQWAAVSGVTNYTVKVYQNSSEVVAARQTGVTGTSVTISGLSSKTAYTYTATAIGDGSLIPNSNESSTASVTTKSTDKAITSFSVAGQQPSSNINESAKTVTVYVAPGTSLSSLTPTITVSANATVSPASGVTTDFTNTVSYTVTAEDGSQQVYSVRVLLGSSATDYFKSKISGNWSNYTTWQSSSDNQNWMDASLVPDYNSTSIQIKNGTIVSVDASTTIDDMSIDSGGEVDVISGQTFTVSNGTLATDLDISGKFKNNGTVTISTGATVVAERGALYDHALGGATLTAPPTISWSTGSTLKISGTYTNATATSAGSLPSGTYKNILISCNITTSDAFMVLGGISIDTLSIEATGNGEILSTTGSATTCATYSQKGGNFYCQRGSSSTRSLTVTGNCSVSGGVLDIRQGASSGLGQLFVGGDLSITGSGSLISNPSSTGTATLVFNGSGIQNFINTGSITASGTNGAIAIVVNSTATLNMSSSTFGTSNSTFTTQTGATLKTSHASGINGNLTVTGTKTLDQGTNYIFNGAATQVTGALLTTANNIEIANSSGVSLSANTTVNGTLNLTSGQLNKNGFTLTLGNSATVATTAGSLSGAPTFGTSVNLIYTGASTKGNEFPATDIVNSLTANNTAGIALASNYNIPTVSIGSGSSISVAAGKQLTVGTSFTNAGTLNLASDDTGTATILTPSTITGSGTANVQQYMTTGRNWYVSCPVTSSASSVLNLGTSVVSYNEPNASWDTETALTPGKGYISVATTGTAAPVTFSGTLNNGNIPVALTRTAGQTKEGFNLVGNPYPSYLIWNEATATAANTLTTIWYRTKDAGVYAFYTYNPVSDIAAPSTAGITAYIPPMQAFWVRVNSGGGTLSFSNAMRAHADVSTNMLKVKSSTQNTQQVLRLQVSNGTNSDETVVLFNPNASNLLDNYDSPKMSNTNKVIPELFTTIDNNELVINGLNSTETVSELPLGFRTGETNNFTIKAIQVSNFAPDMHIILRDIDQKTEQDITNGTAYSFSSSETSSAGRFAVIFKSNSTTTGLHNNALSNVAVYRNANNQILISCPEALIGNSSVTVFNAIGQTLLGSLVNSTKTVVGNNLTPGVYVVVFKSEAETVSRKVVIE